MNTQEIENFLSDYLQNLCVDSEDVKSADKKVSDYIDQIADANTAWEAGWLISNATYQHERQGFFGGFMYAVSLLNRGVVV